MSHLCLKLNNFLSSVADDWYETKDGIHITIKTWRCDVGYILKYCPFCFSEPLGNDTL